MWAKARYGENPYLESLALVLWIVPMLFGLSYTELKGRSGRVKAVFIGGLVGDRDRARSGSRMAQ